MFPGRNSVPHGYLGPRALAIWEYHVQNLLYHNQYQPNHVIHVSPHHVCRQVRARTIQLETCVIYFGRTLTGLVLTLVPGKPNSNCVAKPDFGKQFTSACMGTNLTPPPIH